MFVHFYKALVLKTLHRAKILRDVPAERWLEAARWKTVALAKGSYTQSRILYMTCEARSVGIHQRMSLNLFNGFQHQQAFLDETSGPLSTPTRVCQSLHVKSSSPGRRPEKRAFDP